jgi:hypothetical protein
MFLNSCSAGNFLEHKSDSSDISQLPIKYSILFIIHGDGNYLYHDTNGKKHIADIEVQKKAEWIAKQNPQAEVFIFHRKPKEHFLFFLPKKDGEFYYYRNGQPIENKLYWNNQKKSNYETEAEFYKRYSVTNQNDLTRIFLYFGHEIPEHSLPGYDASYPERIFTINTLSTGLNKFTDDSSKFDLIILSTCYGGTPYTIGKLSPFTNFIIASPENLHLSYFDLEPLKHLELNLYKDDVNSFAKIFAKNAFERLSKDVHTTVSIAVYDVKRVGEYINSVQKYYDTALTDIEEDSFSISTKKERCDCADISEYRLPTINEGVDMFYRPPLFGRSNNKQTHSGWECYSLNEKLNQ